MNASPEFEAIEPATFPGDAAARACLEAVADGVALLHRVKDGVAVEWVSARFAAALGCEASELVGQPLAALRLERLDGSAFVADPLGAHDTSTLVRIRARDGERRARLSSRSLEGSADRAVLTLSELESVRVGDGVATASFGAVAGYLRSLVSLLEPDGTIRQQFGAADVGGRDPGSRRGGSIFDFTHPDDVPRVRDWLARLAKLPRGLRLDDLALSVLHGDGTWHAVRVRGTNLIGDPAVRALLAEVSYEAGRSLAHLVADQARDQLRDAADGARTGFFEYDVTADKVEVSDECYLMRGFSPPATRVSHVGAYLRSAHPQDEAALRDGLDRLIAGPENDWDVEFRVPAQPGEWIWVHQRARAIERDASGRAKRIVGILLDVDRRKRAERGLSQSESRYRTVVAMSPGFVHESAMDADGRLMFRWASEGFTRILGWTIEEVNERGGFRTIIHPDYRAAAAARRADALSGEPVHGETRLLTKSGDYVWFAVSAFPLQEPETGRIVSMMGSLHEITGLKLAEERLRASEERFRLAADAVRGIIYERDAKTEMVTCSNAVAGVLGYGQEAISAHLDWWLERVHPDDVARFRAERGIDDGRRAVSSRYRLRHADGRYVDVLDRAVRVRDASGEIIRYVGCAMDVSRERRAERSLREAEALAHVGSWELDLRRQQLRWSDEAHRIHGTNRDAFKPTLEAATAFYTPESMPVIRAAIQRTLTTGKGFDLELEIDAADGVRRWVRINGRIERSDEGPLRLYGAIQDIDALKRSERRIREQSDRLRLAMDAAQMLAWRWHPNDGRFVVEYRSPAFDAAIRVGSTLDSDLEDVYPDDAPRLRTALARAGELGQPAELEFRIIDTTERLRWLQTRFIPATSEEGPVVIGATYDITARRAAEEALRSSEAVLRSVSENSPDFILVADEHLRVTFVNRGFRGRSTLDGVVQPFALTPAGELLDPEQRLRGVLSTGRPVRFESQVRGPDGEEILLENRVGPVEQSSRITGIIVYSTDITDRRALEREILEVSNREQRRIGSDLHDGLGQELTGIALLLRGLASSVDRGAPPASRDLEEVLGLVNGAIDTTRTLARGLSPVALEGGGLAYALRALAARARDMYGLDVHFRSRVSPRVTLDAAATGHLYRIAQESLTNVARHAHAGSATVQLTVRGRRVSLAVTDDGRGIPAAAASGMGLKIMRYRAHMLGGELSIEPGPDGRGTRIACSVMQPDPDLAADGGQSAAS